MSFTLDLARRIDSLSHELKLCILNFEHLHRVSRVVDERLDRAEVLLVLAGQERQRFTAAADTCRSTAPVHVDLRIERCLIVHHILYVRYVEASCGDICADQDGSSLVNQGRQLVIILLAGSLRAKLESLRLNALHSRLEPV